MRPIGNRESQITKIAVANANISERDLLSMLAHLRRAPNKKGAAIVRAALKRIASVRDITLPARVICREACCKVAR